jgi:hypothetical protein
MSNGLAVVPRLMKTRVAVAGMLKIFGFLQFGVRGALLGFPCVIIPTYPNSNRDDPTKFLVQSYAYVRITVKLTSWMLV